MPTPTPPPPTLAVATLYVVATPIGNREDITLRALRVLKECDVIAAEDTRHTARFLEGHGIRKPLLSHFRFNEARRSVEIVDRLRRGERVALVTDAGTPGISDPGERVIAATLEAGLRVEIIPGPCALVAGIAGSGFPSGRFHFDGFLPVKSGQRSRRLDELLALPEPVVLYESPHRIHKLLSELAAAAPGRPIALARELTKVYEEWLRGTPESVLAELSRRPRRGEFVVVLGPRPD